MVAFLERSFVKEIWFYSSDDGLLWALRHYSFCSGQAVLEREIVLGYVLLRALLGNVTEDVV